MSQITPFGRTPSLNTAKSDDLLDKGEARNFSNKQDDGALASFENSNLQDDNSDPRAGGRAQQRHVDDPVYQAALAARAGNFQRSMSAAQNQGSEADEANIAEDGNEEDVDTFSELPGSGNNRPGQQTSGQQNLSQLFAHNNTSGTKKDLEADEEVLLATSVSSGSTIPILTALQQTNAVQAPVSVSRTQDIISTVENRVSQAIQAEMAASSGSINNISINVAGLIEGLTAITIRLSATGMDIVLSGAVDGLAGEAQALADRLSKRFSNRNVRILSAPAAHESDNGNEDTQNQSLSVLNAPIKGPDSIS